MKITMSQINVTIGDLHGNTQRVMDIIQKNYLSDLIIFPELTLTGYYPYDLLDQPSFIDQQLLCLDQIIQYSSNISSHIVLGSVLRHEGPGKKLFNSLVIIHQGRVVASTHKQLLPTYNIFDERRHFESGTQSLVHKINDTSIGFMICEDGWNDSQEDYAQNPWHSLISHGAEMIISINASPWQQNKHHHRLRMFSALAAKYNVPFIYANQVGGHDDVLYDGSSFALSSLGHLIHALPFAEESVSTFNFSTSLPTLEAPWPQGMQGVLQMLMMGLRDYMQKCQFEQVVVGSSGGIDSAVTLALATQALGAKNVKAITMPSSFSSSSSVDDSVELCKNLGIELFNAPIKSTVHEITSILESQVFGSECQRLTTENMQARIRGLYLMAFTNQNPNTLLLSTGNKSEVSVGYCTLYGDMNGGLNLIGDAYKTEVYALARCYNEMYPNQPIPLPIIDKAPSAELFPGQKDSDALPPYELLDAILRLYLEKDLLSHEEIQQAQQILNDYQASDELCEKIMRMVDRNEFKRRQSCPILRIHARSFGDGRRYPLAQQFINKAMALR